jgi:ATP-dependent DNA ligase
MARSSPTTRRVARRSRRYSTGTAPRTIVFYAFNVLHLNGVELTSLSLEARRAKLPAFVGDSGLVVSQDLPGTAVEVVKAVRNLRLEGVIAKRRDSTYEPGERSGAWVKLNPAPSWLERLCCECYAVVKRESDRLLRS